MVNWNLLDTQAPQKLAALFDPNLIKERQANFNSKTLANLAGEVDLNQRMEQMRRAPELAKQQDWQFQQQQAEALRRTQDFEAQRQDAEAKRQAEARRQAMLAQLPEDQQRMIGLGVPAKDVMMPAQEKPLAIIQEMRAAGISETSPEGQRILRQRVMGNENKAAAPKLTFSESQGGFIEPPSAQFPQGRIIPIQGFKDKIDTKSVMAKEKEALRTKNAIDRSKLVIDTVDDALKKTGFFSTGLTGAALGRFSGTGAYDLRRDIDTIVANIGFSELQAMREASPTGGALGQVAVQELQMLQSVIGSLDANQSEPEIRKKLQQVRLHYDNWKKTMQAAQSTQDGWEDL